MSLNSPDAYLNINNANLRVYGNVHTNQVHLGNMTVRPSYGLSTVTDVSNTTPDTIQFTNTHTAFTTTGNVTVGKELTVTGNVEVGTANLFVDTQNGRVGVGTTEPSGQLELVGDSTTQEYPPRALTGYSTHIEGHGVFGLHHTPGSGASGAVVNAFNKSTAVGDRWYSSVQVWTPGGQNVAGPFNYTGTHSIAGISGEWVYITLPYHVNMEYLQITAHNGDAANAPNSATIIGSSDGGTTWEQVGSWSDKTSSNFWLDGGVPSPNFTITSTKPLNAIGFVVTEANGWYAFTIGEIKFFGTPGPTTLDKGSLTLGRSFDVPRISRYDVDTETPRPEKLVVDFDTTVNSSPTDISGKGNHGAFYNGAYYSAADKAFNFDGTDDYIYLEQSDISGTNATQSWSLWFKSDDGMTNNEYHAIFEGGVRSTNQAFGAYLIQDGSNLRVFYHRYGNNLPLTNNGYIVTPNRWYHIAGTTDMSGSVSRFYVDGVQIAQDTYSSFNITHPRVRIGSNVNGGEFYKGAISNFKLYSVALESSEIQKLYRLGRTGRSMVISDTAVGIGKVPEAQLDVRGTANFAGNVGIGTINPGFPLTVIGNAAFGNSKIRTLKAPGYANAGQNVGVNTGISMNGLNGGGTVLIFVSVQNNNLQNTGSIVHLINKYYNGAESKTSLSTALLWKGAYGSAASATVSFYTDSSAILHFKFTDGGYNYKWSAYEM
jgi:hypothetical protein